MHVLCTCVVCSMLCAYLHELVRWRVYMCGCMRGCLRGYQYKIYFYHHIKLLSPSLRRTSAPIQFAIVLGVLGTQEISCIWLQGCSRETIFILHLPRIDKPYVIHLREICYCPTNMCACRPNNVYKKKVV